MGVKCEVDAPVAGEIMGVKVKVGDKVKPKTTLAVVNTMKMAVAIDSPMEGTVTRVLAEPNMKCGPGDILIEIE